MTQLPERFASPDQFLLAFQGNDAAFIEMDRDAYHRSIFLDGRISPRKPGATLVPIDSLCQAIGDGPVAADIGLIFHVAHCGSTLLARALDRQDENLVLREPMALRQLGVMAAAGAAETTEWKRRAKLLYQMYSRRYVDGPVIVKANVPVNFLIPSLTEIVLPAAAIALYLPLDDYLIAVLRSPGHRQWVGRVCGELGAGIKKLTGHTTPDLPVQAAALLWLTQMRLFQALLATNPKAASLNAEDLFNRPRETLTAAFAHFGQSQPRNVIDRIVDSDLFARHSKNPSVAFSNAARLERKQKLRSEIAADLTAARKFIESAHAANPLPARLDSDLLGGGSDLLVS